MSAFSTPQFSPEIKSSKIAAHTPSNTGTLFALLNDDNTFTISIETLIKATAINQTPITNKNSRIVKQTISPTQSLRNFTQIFLIKDQAILRDCLSFLIFFRFWNILDCNFNIFGSFAQKHETPSKFCSFSFYF